MNDYNSIVSSLRERIRTKTVEVTPIDNEETCCYFCFEKPGELVVDQRYPLDERCYQEAKTHVYVNNKPYDMN